MLDRFLLSWVHMKKMNCFELESIALIIVCFSTECTKECTLEEVLFSNLIPMVGPTCAIIIDICSVLLK